MFVSNWMTKNVFAVTPDDSISDAVRMMKENGIKHLPVVEGDRVRGILSDRDIKEFTPSKATTLDIYELHYLLAKTKIKEVMKKQVITTTPDAPIEEAAMIMYDQNIGCLPVVENERLVGIISDKDIFRALVDITGIRRGGHRINIVVEDRPGSIKEVADTVRNYGFMLQSILTSYERIKEGYRNVIIRTKGAGDFKGLKEELEKKYTGIVIS
ncbi:MAG: CBS and ACT domain-containing protein [Nitrospirota bacterium]|nr:CBS and ACT domain-containing protein [Nitrospirota bacterium]MDH5768593.1 CBS and ACT domain-containing protein [Nitrospirota bacterium]